MEETRFDTLVQTAAGRVGRRKAIKALVAAGLGLALTSGGWDRTSGLLIGPPWAGAAETTDRRLLPAQQRHPY